jgi:hypothetical protein
MNARVVAIDSFSVCVWSRSEENSGRLPFLLVLVGNMLRQGRRSSVPHQLITPLTVIDAIFQVIGGARGQQWDTPRPPATGRAIQERIAGCGRMHADIASSGVFAVIGVHRVGSCTTTTTTAVPIPCDGNYFCVLF